MFLAPTPQTMDVFAFAHHLRRQRACADVPLVLLWPLVPTDDEDAALRAAAAGPSARLEDVLELLDAPTTSTTTGATTGTTTASAPERRDTGR